MDLIRLIIESQRRRRRGSQDEVRLRHVDRQIQRRFVPRGVRDGGEVIKPGIRIFAATILILESQLERFRQVEALQCSIERWRPDRKSIRLNSSHTVISYAVFCLKKKKKKQNRTTL